MSSAVRGCGRRKRGAVYLEVPLSSRGKPLDAFLLCPPQPIDAAALRLEPRGVRLVQHGERTHVFDWVGASHYPNVADVIAEIRRHGVSRRISANVDFSQLTPGSCLVLVHARAIIADPVPLRDILRVEAVEQAPGWPVWSPRASCPQRVPAHSEMPVSEPSPGFMCQSLYWETVEGGDVVLDPAVPWRTVDRTIGETTYRARRTPEGLPELTYALGAFAMLPIGQITVIRDPDGGTHEAPFERAQQSDLPVTLDDE